jgi:interleukin-like EMT inducer protein
VTAPAGREIPGPARLLAVYAAFLALVCLYTMPLVLDPGAHLRRFFDVHYFVGVHGWIARRLLEAPGSLFDINLFYPHGLSLAYSEPMLLSAILVFTPVYWVSRNPILAYTVTVVLFQALAGWAAYYAARRLTGSEVAGWVGGIVFALCPFRTDYYQFAHMQLSFATPLSFVAFARFLERERVWDLVWALVFLWCQMITVMYFGIPLTLMLAGLALGYLLLRPRPWPWRARTLAALAGGGVALALALLPVGWPYLVTRAELGFERGLEDAITRSADILTYVDAGPQSRLYRLAESGRLPALFPGFTVYALALCALLLGPRPVGPSLPRVGVWARQLVGGGLALTLGAIAVFLVTGGGEIRVLGMELSMTELDRAVVALLGLGTVWLALEGWAWVRAGGERALGPREWAPLLGLLALFFALLSLGPLMQLGGRNVGDGLYAWLYPLFPPLRAMRITLRIGFAAMLLLGLLAGFGVVALRDRLARTRFAPALALVPLLILVEYLPRPLTFDVIRWDNPPAVYRWLAQQPGDFAILEWPSFNELPDATYGMWTVLHGKRLVNGSSGFDPPFTEAIREAGMEMPSPEAVARIRSIYPLGYVLAHLDELRPEERVVWEGFGQAPPEGLRVVGRFGPTLVLEPAGTERSRRWERTFSTDLVAARPTARLRVALARPDPEIQPAVEVRFNDRPLTRLTPGPEPAEVRLPLPPPYPRVDRNVVELAMTYRLRPDVPADPRYRIGETGTHSPADLTVMSAGKAHGRAASILVNGVDLSRHRRGYNVVVLDPATGEVRARELFDTFIAQVESARLAAFIDQVPAGAIVVAAVKEDGVGQLGDDGVRALRSIGGRIDPRSGGLFVSHLVIGVKGAPPGTAVEALGPERLTRSIGKDRADRLLVIDGFRLE